MLQRIRENVQGWAAWVIVIFLSLVFGLWGISGYFDPNAANVAAEVDGVEISSVAVENTYQQRYNQLVQMLGDNFSPELVDSDALRRDVLQQLILRELVQQHVDKFGYRPSGETLRENIRNMQAFQVDGEFSQDQYRLALGYQGLSPAGFEAIQRRNIAINQLQRGINESTFATPLDVAFQVALREQARSHEDLLIRAARFFDSVEVTEEDILAYYEENTAQFMTTESADIAYIVVDKADFAAAEEVSDEELEDFYQQRVDGYMSQEQRRASHILIEGDGQAALEQAESLRERIANGESFEELAREFSADTISSEEGGDLGLIERGQLEGNFEDALFALQEGEVSEPVQTDFGFHIIKLTGVQAPEVPELADIRDELLEEYQAIEAEQAFEDAVQQVIDITYADSGSLAGAADELGLEVKSVEGVTRSRGEDIAAIDQVRNAVFSQSVLEDRLNSDPIRLEDGRVVVTRIVEHYPSEPKSLEEVSLDIREIVKRRKASAEAEALAASIAEQVREGQSLAEIAAAEGFAYRGERRTLRSTSDLASSYTAALFAADYPGENGEVDQVRINGTDFVVFRLTAIDQGDLGSLTSSERDSRNSQLAARRANIEFEAYLKEMRDSANVNTFEGNLEQ